MGPTNQPTISSRLACRPDDAVFARLPDGRFGSTGDLHLEVLGLYAWTDGHFPPTETDPDRGRLVGVAIHYRAEVDDNGVGRVQEAVTTLRLGTLPETSLDADLQGLIHDEKVYHEPASLLAALQSGGEGQLPITRTKF